MNLKASIARLILPSILRTLGLQQLNKMFLSDQEFSMEGGRRPSDPYNNILWVFRCISAISTGLAALPLMLTNQSDALIESGPLYGLLRQPTVGMSGNTFVKWLALWLNLKGEFFILKMRADVGGTTAPTELLILPPDKMEEETAVHAVTRQKLLIGWKLKIENSGTIRIAMADVIHAGFPNPLNPIRGLAPWEACWPSGQSYMAAEKYNARSFENQAVPSGLLTAKIPLNDDQIKSARTQFTTQYAGLRNSKKIIALGSDWNYQAMSLAPKDLEYINGQELDILKICAAFGVPPSEVGWMKDAHEANAREQKLTFWQNTMIPQSGIIASSLQSGLVDQHDWQIATSPGRKPNRSEVFALREIRKGSAVNTDARSRAYVWLDYSSAPALMWDRQGRHDTAIKAFSMGIPPNDIIAKLDLGYEHLPWGDTGFLPFSLAPADEILSGGSAAGPAGAAAPQGKATLAQSFDQLEETVRALGANQVRDLRTRRWQDIHSRALGHERKLKRVLRSYFASQRTGILSRLYSRKSASAPVHKAGLIVEILFDLAKENARLIATVEPFLKNLIAGEGTTLAKELGTDAYNPDSEMATEHLSAQLDRFTKINDTTHQRLQEDLQEGLDAGEIENTDALAERVRNVFRDAENRPIAGTETFSAFNAARQDAMDQSGITHEEWLSARDAAVRPSHVEADGQVVAIGEPFIVGGIELIRPGDPDGPPEEVINCRCITVPVTNNSEE